MKIQEVILRTMAKKITWWQEIVGISDRQMRRWYQRYQEFGYDGLFDRRLGRPSPHADCVAPSASSAARAQHVLHCICAGARSGGMRCDWLQQFQSGDIDRYTERSCLVWGHGHVGDDDNLDYSGSNGAVVPLAYRMPVTSRCRRSLNFL